MIETFMESDIMEPDQAFLRPFYRRNG